MTKATKPKYGYQTRHGMPSYAYAKDWFAEYVKDLLGDEYDADFPPAVNVTHSDHPINAGGLNKRFKFNVGSCSIPFYIRKDGTLNDESIKVAALASQEFQRKRADEDRIRKDNLEVAKSVLGNHYWKHRGCSVEITSKPNRYLVKFRGAGVSIARTIPIERIDRFIDLCERQRDELQSHFWQD